jgi:hypothetical protein
VNFMGKISVLLWLFWSWLLIRRGLRRQSGTRQTPCFLIVQISGSSWQVVLCAEPLDQRREHSDRAGPRPGGIVRKLIFNGLVPLARSQLRFRFAELFRGGQKIPRVTHAAPRHLEIAPLLLPHLEATRRIFFAMKLELGGFTGIKREHTHCISIDRDTGLT